MDSYKDSKNEDESKVQNNRFISHFEKGNQNDDLTIIDYWRQEFSKIYQATNKIDKNYSSIYEALYYFRTLITSKNYPPIELAINDDMLFFFISFLKQPWPSQFKVKCISIIDCFVTYLKSPLIDLAPSELIESMLLLLLDQNIQTDPYYPSFIYLITKIFKTSSFFSPNFALLLYNSPFLSEFVIKYLNVCDLPFINKFPVDDHISFYTSFICIVQIFSTWLHLTYKISDESIDCIIKLCIQLFQFNINQIDDNICEMILDAYETHSSLPLILVQNNFFEMLWNAIQNQIQIPKGMDLLSTGLLFENCAQKNIADIVDLKIALNIGQEYLNLSLESHDEEKLELEKYLESSIVLIANYISYLNKLPNNVTNNEVISFIKNIFINSNYSVKNCASFLMLELLSSSNFREIDQIYPKDFIGLFFDIITSGNDDVIQKAIQVFEEFLTKAAISKYEISKSAFFNNFVPEFFINILDANEDNDVGEISKNILSRFYSDVDINVNNF